LNSANIIDRPVNLFDLKESLIALLTFLNTKEGRTNDNCRAVDLFFCLQDDWDLGYKDLPEPFSEIIIDMGGALHDTINTPDIAKMLDSTPEQLLDRVRKIEV